MTNALLWLDLETTGTDETKDAIIEIGVIPTTTDLEQLGEWSEVVAPTDEGLGRLLRTTPVRQMHEANGLLDELIHGQHPTIGAAEHRLDVWLTDVAQYHGISRWVLAGSGVGHFDRRFIKVQMPKLERALAHWCIDVGVLRRAYAMWGRDGTEVHAEGKTHRALDDAYVHLKEARVWRDYFMQADDLLEVHT